jgi:hypothetical protein
VGTIGSVAVLAAVQCAPRSVLWNIPMSVPTNRPVKGREGSKIALSAGISGNPALISLQVLPKSLDRNAWCPPPLKPDTVITTWAALNRLIAIEVKGRLAIPGGVMGAKVGLMLVPSLATHANGPFPLPAPVIT